MSENGIGGVLGTATVLPATTALSVFLVNKAHPAIIFGFVGLNLLVLILTIAKCSRYLINKND